MSLDKWLKSEKEEKKEKKEPSKKEKKEEKPTKKKLKDKTPKTTNKEKESQKKVVSSAQRPQGIRKYVLTCPKKSCKYQKIKVIGGTKQLTVRDKTCPKCGADLRVREK